MVEHSRQNNTSAASAKNTRISKFFVLVCGLVNMSDDEMDVSDGDFVSGSDEVVSDDDWKEEKPILAESKSYSVMQKNDVIQQVKSRLVCHLSRNIFSPLFFFFLCPEPRDD